MFQTISPTGHPLLAQFLWTFGSLAVLGLATWAMLRFGAPKLQNLRGPRRMRVLEKLPLEPGRSLVLVEIDGKTVLLGLAPGQITRLNLDAPSSKEAIDA